MRNRLSYFRPIEDSHGLSATSDGAVYARHPITGVLRKVAKVGPQKLHSRPATQSTMDRIAAMETAVKADLEGCMTDLGNSSIAAVVEEQEKECPKS